MMVAGIVTIVGGVASGTGFAREVYDVLEAGTEFPDNIPITGLQRAKEQLAAIANACAELITYVQTNGMVSTSITASGTPIAWTGTGSGTVA